MERAGHIAAAEVLPYRWVILAVTMLSQASVTVIQQGMAALAPYFQSAFHLTRGEVGLITVAVSAGSVVAMLAGGWAADLFGERRVLALTGAAIGVTVIVAASAGSYVELVLLLAVAGLWSATAPTAGSKAVMGWFPAGRRGMAMSTRQMAVPLGGTLAALVLPVIAARSGWPAALIAGGALAIVAAVVVGALFRSHPANGEVPRAARRLELGPLLRNRDIVLTTAVAMCFSCGQWTVVSFVVLYAKEALGLPLAVAGLLLAVAQLSGAGGRVGWGLLSDTRLRGSRVRALRWSGLVALAMALATAQLAHGAPPGLIVGVVIVFGLATIGWNGVYATLVSELAGHARAGSALGLSLTFVYLTISAAPPLFGLLVDRTGSYALAWRLLAVVLALGTALTWLIREERRAAPAAAAATR